MSHFFLVEFFLDEKQEWKSTALKFIGTWKLRLRVKSCHRTWSRVLYSSIGKVHPSPFFFQWSSKSSNNQCKMLPPSPVVSSCSAENKAIRKIMVLLCDD